MDGRQIQSLTKKIKNAIFKKILIQQCIELIRINLR
jgi:hypothetical protein